MSRRKILHIVEAMGGGIFTYLVGLTNELVKNNDIYIAYGLREQTPDNFKRYFDENINLIEVKSFTREINIIKDLKAFHEIRSIEKEIDPDVIHLHSSKAGALGRIAFNFKTKPVFYTPHGYSFLMENEHRGKRLIYKSIEWICGKLNSITISCSEGENNESKKISKKSILINNAINIDELKELTSNYTLKNNDQNKVFTLGRVCYQKNPKLFNEIARSFPDIKFTRIGDGELINELSSPNITVTGWLSKEEALKIAMNSNIFILTSLWEGLPLSLLESMYLKKICIVSNVIGNRDVIINGNNGFLCSELEEYKNVIKKLPNVNTSVITKNAYDDILRNYTTFIQARNYEKVYFDNLNSN